MAKISNPRKQFNFTVLIAPTPLNPFLVQKVTIPSITLEVAEHGDVNFNVKTAGKVTYDPIVMEKIMSTSGADSFFYDWAMSASDPLIGGGLVPSQYKRVVTITELAEDGTSALNVWVATGAFPSKINGMDLDRMSSDNTIESVEITFDKLEKI